MASAKPLRDHRARRWCTRAFIVLGGAVAGTVAAWALSTTGAAAADERDDRSWPRATELAAQTRKAIESGAERVGDELRSQGKPDGAKEPTGQKPDGDADTDAGSDADANRDPLHERWSHDDVESSLRETSGESLDGVSGLLERLLGSEYRPPEHGENPFGCDGEFAAEFCDRIDDWFDPDDVVGELPDVDPESPDATGPGGPSSSEGTDAVRADTAGLGGPRVTGADESGTSERGSPAGWTLAATDFPGDGIPSRMPTGAPVAPSTAGAGTAGASHADGSPQVITSILGRASAAATACEANTGAAAAPVEPGRQPGVTPD